MGAGDSRGKPGFNDSIHSSSQTITNPASMLSGWGQRGRREFVEAQGKKLDVGLHFVNA